MSLRVITAALLLMLANAWLLAPDYAHPSCGPNHPPKVSSTPSPKPVPVQPIQPGNIRPPVTPPSVRPPVKPFSAKVPAKNPGIKKQLIDQITTKYAIMETFVTNKYLTERGKMFNAMNMLNTSKIPSTAKMDLAFEYAKRLTALDAAYLESKKGLKQRKDTEIRAVNNAR